MSICWPDSLLWRVLLRGLVTEPARGFFWDERTGWVKDVESGAKSGITGFDWLGLIMISFILPAVITPIFNMLGRKLGWVKDGDMKLD